MNHAAALKTVKIVHTIAWVVLVACILGIPWASWRGRHELAAVLAGIVLLEVLVLIINGWRCPLTLVAERYTDDRRDNFDIYLPEWLARHNKTIFGVIYVLGVTYAGLRYWR
jgi:polyferredoxin